MLSGTFLFAMVTPYLNHSISGLMDKSVFRVLISLCSLQSRAGGKVEDGSVHYSCHSNMEETPNMDDKKTPGPCGHTEISRKVVVKSCPRPKYWGLF